MHGDLGLGAAAEQGYAPAQNNLGLLYLNGKGVQKDLKQAFELFQKSAGQDYAFALNNLGGAQMCDSVPNLAGICFLPYGT